jgi:hypothetical protein
MQQYVFYRQHPGISVHCRFGPIDLTYKSIIFLGSHKTESTSCPQRGCYDCPKFAPGKNPYFQELLSESTHVRAEYFKDTGTADAYRKTMEL